jgi:hypothetical protein
VDPTVSRRAVLGAGIAALGLAACGKGGDEKSSSPTTKGDLASNTDELELIIASAQVVASPNQRVTLGVVRDGDFVRDPEGLTIGFGRSFDDVNAAGKAEFHHEGIEDRPYYKTSFTFPAAGMWVVAAKSGGKTGAAQFKVEDPAASKVPLVGQKMIPVATPTTKDARGVNPICTLDPPCPFHEVSLDAALAEGRPVATIFSTPALCQSRVCGPVLEILVKQAPAVADKVRFVHIEPYKSLQSDFTANSLSDGMKAYNLTFEPILFLSAPDGTVRERLDGPFDAVEARDALNRLVAGA